MQSAIQGLKEQELCRDEKQHNLSAEIPPPSESPVQTESCGTHTSMLASNQREDPRAQQQSHLIYQDIYANQATMNQMHL